MIASIYRYLYLRRPLGEDLGSHTGVDVPGSFVASWSMAVSLRWVVLHSSMRLPPTVGSCVMMNSQTVGLVDHRMIRYTLMK